MRVRYYSPTLAVLMIFFAAACTPNDAAAQQSGGSEENIDLPDPLTDGEFSLERALAERRSIREFSGDPLDLETVSQLLWATQGISDERGGLRTAPSAGALYGLDTYIAVGEVDGMDAGLFRYDPEDHKLLPRGESDLHDSIVQAALGQSWIADASVVLIIIGVPERLESRYRERAERYTILEAGHAAQNLSLQAVALDLGSTVVGAFSDSGIRELLDIPEEHIPLYVIPVGAPR